MKTPTYLFSYPKSVFPSDDFRSFNYRGKWQKKFIDNYINEAYANGFDEANLRYSGYKIEHFPNNLYKFFSPTTYSLINLENKTLWLSTPSKFNDPFDSYVGVEEITYIKKYILKELKKRKLISDNISHNTISQKEYWRLHNSYSKDRVLDFCSHQKEFFTEYINIINGKSDKFQLTMHKLYSEGKEDCVRRITDIRNIPFRITCFSNFKDEQELGLNTTMWSHYADNHRGFCIKYSLDLDKSPIKDIIKCGLYEVMYSHRISNASTRELMKLKYNKDNQLIINNYLHRTIYKALITKSRFWSYEKEWRLIISKNDFNILRDGNIPFPFVDTIYLGCKMEKSLVNFIVKFAKSNNIIVYQARQSNEKFNLEFDNIK